MMIFSSSKVFFVLIVSSDVVKGTLSPGGKVSVDCDSAQIFTCNAPYEPLGWIIAGLSGVNMPGPFRALVAAQTYNRITSNDTGANSQVGVSVITISGFSRSDNGGIIQCVNMMTNSIKGMANVSVGLRAPANVVAKAKTCNTVNLKWTQPSEPNDITTSVSCTPPSPGCAQCTTSQRPCTINGLTPSSEYEFTVTFNSVMCGTSMNTTMIGTRDLRAPTNVVATVQSCDTVTLQWTKPSVPNDITTSVSCTPPSPGCAECKSSPCTITGLNASNEYEFTVTLNSRGCRKIMNTATARTMDLPLPTNLRAAVESCNSVTLQWDQSSEPNDITTSVSCTPHSPGCAECTTSPCTIISLTPSTEYVFTVTLNSGQCRASMNSNKGKTKGLGAPTNVVAELGPCDTVILEWTQPSEPADITTLVSCTPPSPGCAECTTNPCTITGLNPNSEYKFTVTLNSSVCATSMNTTTDLKIEDRSCVTSNSPSNSGTSLAPLAALAVLVLLLILLIYPLGVLIAKVCCFRDKSYCQVFWCCSSSRKDKSPRYNSTELMKSPHPREEVEQHQNMYKGKHIQFITDGKQNKDQRGNKQEHVVTYETAEQLGDDDGDIITDETTQQQENEDGITYATLDFSGHRKGNINVVHSITDEVTYAAV